MQFKNKKYAIRKLTMGVASIVIGTIIYNSNNKLF